MAIKKQISENRHLYATIHHMEVMKNLVKLVLVAIETRSDATNEVLHRDHLNFWPLQTESEQAYFQLDALNPADENIIKAAYLWLKAHKPMFEGWEDA